MEGKLAIEKSVVQGVFNVRMCLVILQPRRLWRKAVRSASCVRSAVVQVRHSRRRERYRPRSRSVLGSWRCLRLLPFSPSTEPSPSSQPALKRPETNSSYARRMIGHALGQRISVSREKVAAESQQLRDARGESGSCFVFRSLRFLLLRFSLCSCRLREIITLLRKTRIHAPKIMRTEHNARRNPAISKSRMSKNHVFSKSRDINITH